eukprot:3603383-Rhodomonas_salina.1
MGCSCSLSMVSFQYRGTVTRSTPHLIPMTPGPGRQGVWPPGKSDRDSATVASVASESLAHWPQAQ